MQSLKILELSIDLGHPIAGCTLNMLGVEF
jgi:hypothetical protein